VLDRKPIVVVGSINMDLVVTAKRIPAPGETILGSAFHTYPGGKGANQAVAIGRLGYPVRMIGRVGQDSFGAELRVHLEDAGVELGGVDSIEGSSGIALIVVSEAGENSIVVTPGANSAIRPIDVENNIESIKSAGVVLTQLEIPIDTVECLARICSREQIPLILDPAPACEIPRQLLQHVAWLTPNETEAAFYGGHALSDAQPTPASLARLLMSKGAQNIILKLGQRGAYVASATGLGQHVPVFPVEVLDTTAAGDAFNGAFATGLMLGKGPLGATRFATAAASIAVTRRGAQASMPTLTEVEILLASHRKRDGILANSAE
jgi:ribokinase